MSWTDIFPVLDDEMLDTYRAGVTDGEREEFENLFGIEIQTQDCKIQDARQERFARGNGSDAHRAPLHAFHWPFFTRGARPNPEWRGDLR